MKKQMKNWEAREEKRLVIFCIFPPPHTYLSTHGIWNSCSQGNILNSSPYINAKQKRKAIIENLPSGQSKQQKKTATDDTQVVDSKLQDMVNQ